MIPEIDIWRVANLMLTRYGDEAVAEGTKRAEELRRMAILGAWRFGCALSTQSANSHHSTVRVRTLEARRLPRSD